ncbi:MAG TPA: M28 family peptidase [Drouetiella sp.]|jgi:Zn-dependent M28 family amino/carboxypeptidase
MAQKSRRRESLAPLSTAENLVSAKLRAHILMLAGMIGARSLTSNPAGLEKAAQYIEQCLSEFNYARSQQDFMANIYKPVGVTTEGVTAVQNKVCTRNIIAELKGTKLPQEIILLGAHYDSVYDCPAANDNGSGVAALLELARLLSKFESDRTIRFVAFTNEEPPFFGTEDWGAQQYANVCHERAEKVIAMFSLETMGYYSDVSGSQSFPHDVFGLVYPKQGDFIAFVSNMKSRRLLNRVTKLFRNATPFPCEKIAVPESIRGVADSDHAAFWKYDYPALMITDTAYYRYPHYHTREDTPEKIDYDSLARVVFGLAEVMKKLSNG